MGKILHASGSGYFPGCINSNPPETINYQGINYAKLTSSLENIMAFYWRVKKWKVIVSGENASDDNVYIVKLIADFQLPENPLIQSEEYLICQLTRNWESNGGVWLINGEDFFGGSVKVSLDLAPLYYKTNSQVSTYISIIGGPFSPSFPNGGGAFFTKERSASGNSSTGNYEFRFLGQTLSGELFSVPGWKRDGNNPYNVIFTATEYWSYGGTYNTSTGAPL